MAVSQAIGFIRPDWPAPAHVQAVVTTRQGGVSNSDYAGLNLATHVGDQQAAVNANRKLLLASLGLAAEPCWLNQVHGTDIVRADELQAPADADAAITAVSDVVCAVLTADCLPVLLTDTEGQSVAAVHAGWRGMCAGVIENTVSAFRSEGVAAERILAWLGPAIGPDVYEVDVPVRDAMLATSPACTAAFHDSRPAHWYLDLYAAARLRLAALGIDRVYGGGFCTYSEERFFSHRRKAPCGRQASLIWISA